MLGLLAPVHRCARSVRCFACAVSWASWLLFNSVPARCVVLRVRCPGPPGSCSPMCPLGVLCRVCGVLGLLAPVHRCARLVCCVACAVSWASWLLFTGVPAWCVVLRVRCPGPPGSCSPVCPLGVLCCVCGVLGLLAPVHRCARSVCCVACAVSWASWLLFTGVPARCVVSRVRCPGPPGSCSPVCPLGVLCVRVGVVSRVRCPGPPGSCSPVCPLGVLCCVCGVLGLLAPVHRCARPVCCSACAVSWAPWLLFTGVPARCVVLRVRCPGPPGSCSPVCPLGVLCWVCGVLGLLAPVHRCARSVCCFACAVSWASWLLFTGLPARCVVLRCGVLGLLAPVHRCARLVCCVVCAVSWASWLLFTGVPAPCVVLRVRCPGPTGSCSPVCPLGVLYWVCSVLGLLAPVHRCARSVRCFACAVSWANWLLFTGVPARCVVLGVQCPGPPSSSSPVCPLGVLCWVCSVLALLAPVHRCARLVCCVVCAVSWASWLLFTGVPAPCVVSRVRRPGPPGSCSPVCPLGVWCAVSWASWLLFTGVPAPCVVLRVRCPGPTGSCSPVCPLGVLCWVCSVLGLLAPVHRCARLVCCVVCAVSWALAPVHRCACSVRCLACAASWATWLLFTGVPARCVVLRVRRPGPPLLLLTGVPARCIVSRVRCPGPPGSCSPVCPLGVLCWVCGVLGLLAPVYRCARSVRCFACAVSWASWLLFTGAPARCVVLRVRCPGPPGSYSPVCPLGVLFCVCGVLGLLAPVHQCARSVCCFACAVSWASWLLFTGVLARCVVLGVPCPGPPGSCSPVCPLGVLCWVCGVLGLLAPVHRCARSVRCFACAVSWASWLLLTGVPARCVVLGVRCPGPPGSCSPMCPLGVLCRVCGVLGLLASVHRCARSVCCVACAVSWASSLLFTDVPARCVVLRVWCPGPPGSCSPVRPLGVLFCVCGVLGLLAPVHRCARSVCCVGCAVSWASWLLFTGVPARCVVLGVRCPGPLGSCSPVCPLGALFRVCGVLGLLAPVHRCARSVCCVGCAVSWASWLLFTDVPARCVVSGVRCPGPPGSCSPVCPLGVLCCVCGVLGLLAPVHRCARLVCCVACAVSWASWLLFTGVPAWCVVFRVRCPGPPGSGSPVCPLGVLFCVCGVLGPLAPVHRCARSVCCFVCALSWASWLLFTGVPARCVVLGVRCPGPLGSCSPVCPLGALFRVCGVLGLLAPAHRCARSVCCVGCAVSWASWLLFTDVPARCVVSGVRCPGPPGLCSPVRPLGVLCCVCGVLGLLAPVHRCARSVCCFACVVSWASWLLFTSAPARCVVLRVRCPGPPGSCSPVCPLGVLCRVCGVLGLLAPVHRCARSVCCVGCAVSWASWLLFTGVPAGCVVSRVRCPGPPGSCSPVCPLGVLCWVCGVLGLLAPVHRCARSVCCVGCAVSWASWLLFTGVPAWCVVLRVRCPGPPGSCSPVCPLGVLCCVCGVLGLLAPVHRCARLVCCVPCAVSWATWLRFTGVPARCVVLRVRRPGPPGSCSPVCPLGVLFCVCVVLGLLAPFHRCARSVCCVGCAVSWASWLLFTGVPARCAVSRVRCPGPPGSCSPVCPLGVLFCVCGVLGLLAPVHRCARSVCGVRCPGPLGSCSPVCPLGALFRVCGVLGLLAPVHRCARSVCCVACAVSWASWLLFTGVPARCVVLRVRCPGPPGSCSPVCPLGVLFCVCGVLGLVAPVHRCARSVCCVGCAVSWASWLLFTGVPARCVVLRVRCPGPLGSCSPVCPLRVLFRVCGVLGHLAPVHRCVARCVVLRVRCPGPLGCCSPVCPLGVLFCVCGFLGLLAPVHRCTRSLCCVACAVSSASWLLFTGVPAWCVVLGVRCPGPPGSYSSVCPLGVICCVCGVLGLLAPVHRCARSVRCFACAASWATWLLFTGVPARCVVLRVRCPGPPGSCSPACPLRVLFCVCGVLPLLAPVHRCARSVCCVGCAVPWASWLLFTGVPARCVVSRVRCPGPPGSCSPVRPLGVLCCVCGVLGLVAPVHRCARSVCCFACVVSWASWLLFTSVPARCVVLRVRCPGPPGSCSPVCSLGVLCWVCGVLGLLAPVHRFARSVCCVGCAVSWASWLLFTGVPARCIVYGVRCPGPLGSCSPVCPLGALFRVCGVLGLLAPVHRCADSVCCVACAVSWASWLLFTDVPAWCVVSGVRCPGPPGSCSPVCPLGVLCRVCGVLGLLAPVHRCARLVCCVACAVSWASWLLFTGVPAWCVVLRVRCPGPPGSCSPMCPLGVLFCVCGVLGLLAPVHRCARSVCCFACAVSWASWLLFTGVPARCVVLGVRCPGPPGSCLPLCPLGALFRVCGVLGLLAPVHRCARAVCCVACAVSWASWLLFTGVPARCVVLRVRCPGPPGFCSPVCPLGVLFCMCGVLGLLPPVHRCARPVCCVGCAVSWASWLLFTGVPARCVVCGVLGLLAPVHRCARSVRCVACAVPWASWLLFTGVPARCVVLRVRCPGPPGSCSPVCPLGVLFCVCGVLGLLAPVHRCARSVCCFACAVSWTSWLLFTGVPARCVVLGVRCPGPPGSCSPVCPLGALCCVCGVLGLLAPVYRCARSVRCFACAVSWASWLLFTGAPARCVVLRVRCPGPRGSCSPVCPLGVLFCVCGVLGLLAPVQQCARSVCCFACAVSWASWLLFTGVLARCVVLGVRCPGPPGSCSTVCSLGVLCWVCGVLGLLAPVHRCARSVYCVRCAVSWASWLLFTGVPARCVVSRVRCPGPPGSCSPVCRLGVLCCVCGVLGLLAPVHRCARLVCCVRCAVSWASWLLFTGVPAWCVVSRVRCPGPPGSCSPVCPLGVLCCVCGVLGLLAPVHRCARSVCCFACAVSWASWLLFTGVPARCVVLGVRCPGPPGSCLPLCPLGALFRVCGVLGLLAPVHRCARAVCCVACAVSWASWLLFTGVPARCVVLRVRCPGPPGFCSPVCPLGVLFCMCGVLGLLPPVHRCARPVCCVGCAVSWASWLLFTGVPARCVVCGVLGLLAPVHRCARSVRCVACAVSWASWLLFTGVPARCVVLRVRCPGPPGSCSPVCPLGVLFCVCGVLGLLAPVHRCARSVCCFACAVSWTSWLLFTGVPARCVVLGVRCPGPPGSCSPVCPLGVLCCVCGVLGLLAPVHRCARSVRYFACAVSWTTWLLFTGVPLRVLFCVCGVLGLLAAVHRCARSVCCFACTVSWASWLLFTSAPARCVVLRVRCPGPPGSCSPLCPLGVLCCVCGVLGLLAPVHRCARSVCCFACAVSWASCLLFTVVPARCVVLRVRCPGPPGSCSPVCPLGVLFCVCGVLGLLAPVHQCARSVCCVAVRCVAAGRSLVHPDGGYRSRQWLGTLRAQTRPSRRRLFVAGRGWVPSGRALVHPDGGCS